MSVRVDNTSRVSSFYVRSINLDNIQGLIEERIDEDTCITKKISFIELASLIEKLADDSVFVAEVMHDCK